MGLGDFQTALAMRDVLQKLVADEVERQRPRLQYATVTGINRATRKCSVQFPGELVSVDVNMGSIQPGFVGQTVRIDGLGGDRFVADVLGPNQLTVPDVLGSNVDFNTLTTPGLYSQASNSQAATALNKPASYAGILEVIAHANGGMIWQRYTIYNGVAAGDAILVRSYYSYNGTWSPWQAAYYDSGWVNLTPTSPFTSSPVTGQVSAACRRIGTTIRFRGVINGTLAAATTAQIATVPSGYRPVVPNANFGSVQSSGGFVGWANTTDAGALSVHFKTPYAGGTIVIDLTGYSYTLD